MRISDWSSDVCSSDLSRTAQRRLCNSPHSLHPAVRASAPKLRPGCRQHRHEGVMPMEFFEKARRCYAGANNGTRYWRLKRPMLGGGVINTKQNKSEEGRRGQGC